MVIFMPYIYITLELAICNNLSANLLIICGNYNNLLKKLRDISNVTLPPPC